MPENEKMRCLRCKGQFEIPIYRNNEEKPKDANLIPVSSVSCKYCGSADVIEESKLE